MQNYEGLHRVFPYGTIRGPLANVTPTGDAGPNGIYRRQTFVVSLWSQFEEQVIADTYDYNFSFYAPINRQAVTRQVPLYFCPSDRWGYWMGDQYTRSRGNYVLNWGNGSYWQTESNYLKSPFGPNRVIRAAEITDGLSKTMFMSELIQGLSDTDFDFRGDFINDDLSCAQYMTLNTPNAGIDSTYCVDPLHPSPCQLGPTAYVSARSQHTGGVNVSFGDGSVHFVSDEIAIAVWQALGSTKAGETFDPSSVGL